MSNPGHLHQLFPTCLYVADVENSTKINAEMLPHILKLREQDLADVGDPEMLSAFQYEVWTTYFSHPGIGLVNESWTQQLQSVVLDHIAHFVTMLQYDFGKRRPRVTTLFANIHDKMYHHHDAHTHPGSMFSGTYYLRAGRGAGRFRFMNPARALRFHEFSTLKDTELNVDEVSLDPVVGRIVLFPSHVPHAVDRPTEESERIAVAFNVNYE